MTLFISKKIEKASFFKLIFLYLYSLQKKIKTKQSIRLRYITQ